MGVVFTVLSLAKMCILASMFLCLFVLFLHSDGRSRKTHELLTYIFIKFYRQVHLDVAHSLNFKVKGQGHKIYNSNSNRHSPSGGTSASTLWITILTPYLHNFKPSNQMSKCKFLQVRNLRLPFYYRC